ncbi:MAG: hypothetical protein ACFCA4_00225 [Cyanophyceae cyanobacterium]
MVSVPWDESPCACSVRLRGGDRLRMDRRTSLRSQWEIHEKFTGNLSRNLLKKLSCKGGTCCPL